MVQAATEPDALDPVNPLSYGADNTGVNSSSDAFQNAVNAGDVLIPAGTYKITTQISVPNNRNVRCADPATVTISFPQSTNGYAFLWAGTGPGSIANCTFTGTNTAHPAGYVAANQWNHFVKREYGAHDVWIGNNYFRNCWGNACVHTYTNDQALLRTTSRFATTSSIIAASMDRRRTRRLINILFTTSLLTVLLDRKATIPFSQKIPA